MKLKIGKNLTYEYSKKRLLYMFCFLMFCIIDQRERDMAPNGIAETFRDAMGLVLACIILSHCKLEEFKKWKIPYLIWTVVGVIGGVGAFVWGVERVSLLNDWLVVILDVVLWGYIIIYTFIQVVVEKKHPIFNKKFMIIGFIMMALMIVSRSHYIWPLSYTVMFGCFYLINFSKEEQRDLLQGSLDGIILSFFLFQGFCCVFRPYDAEDFRYRGIYWDCNMNACYYLSVLAAVFAKIIYITKEKVCKRIKVFYWLTAGAVLSFLFMTIGRSAWITAFVTGLLFLGFLNVVLRKKKFIQNGIVLVLCAVLMFPVCFGTARYLPSLFHHPVWFWGEWSEEKVHAWDPWNSEKYVDMDELWNIAMGRIVVSLENIMDHLPFSLKADAAELAAEDILATETAMLSSEETQDGILVRATIYKHYFTHLNWRGHPYEEQLFELSEGYWPSHAHNIYLQYGTDFGIPVMLLFIILIVWSIVLCWQKGVRKESAPLAMANIAALFFILVPALFGLFEYAWGVGSLSITMLFISWRQAMSTVPDSDEVKA